MFEATRDGDLIVNEEGRWMRVIGDDMSFGVAILLTQLMDEVYLYFIEVLSL